MERELLKKAELFDSIEVFYNQQRRHSSLGSLSPAQYERASRSTARERIVLFSARTLHDGPQEKDSWDGAPTGGLVEE